MKKKTCCICKVKDYSYSHERKVYCDTCCPPDAIKCHTHCAKCGDRTAKYGYKQDERYCEECKEEGMKFFRPNGIYCKECGVKRALYGINGKPTHCNLCRKDGMITSKAKCLRCHKTEAYFGFKCDNLPTSCHKCKLPGMIDIKNKRCQECNTRNGQKTFKNGVCALCRFKPIIVQTHLRTKEMLVFDLPLDQYLQIQNNNFYNA